jgi:hypothetical protein
MVRPQEGKFTIYRSKRGGPTRPTIKGTVCHLHVWIAREITVEQISYGMPSGTFNAIVACEPHLGLLRSSTISFVLVAIPCPADYKGGEDNEGKEVKLKRFSTHQCTRKDG